MGAFRFTYRKDGGRACRSEGLSCLSTSPAGLQMSLCHDDETDRIVVQESYKHTILCNYVGFKRMGLGMRI